MPLPLVFSLLARQGVHGKMPGTMANSRVGPVTEQHMSGKPWRQLVSLLCCCVLQTPAKQTNKKKKKNQFSSHSTHHKHLFSKAKQSKQRGEKRASVPASKERRTQKARDGQGHSPGLSWLVGVVFFFLGGGWCVGFYLLQQTQTILKHACAYARLRTRTLTGRHLEARHQLG